MNPRSTDEELGELRERARQLELEIADIKAQQRLTRFVAGALVLSVIALIVNALGELLF